MLSLKELYGKAVPRKPPPTGCLSQTLYHPRPSESRVPRAFGYAHLIALDRALCLFFDQTREGKER